MKRLTPFFVAVVCLGAIHTKLVSQESSILIYHDISGSVMSDNDITDKAYRFVKSYLYTNLDSEPTSVIAGFLFANSGSVLNHQSYLYTPTSSEEDTFVQKARIIQGVRETLFGKNHSSNQTEILSSLRHVLKEASKADSINIIYISDMVESSPIRQLQLHSMKDAREKAMVDITKLKSMYSLSKNSTTEAHFLCLIPLEKGLANENRNFQYIEEYWKSILSELFSHFTIQFQAL